MSVESSQQRAPLPGLRNEHSLHTRVTEYVGHRACDVTSVLEVLFRPLTLGLGLSSYLRQQKPWATSPSYRPALLNLPSV